MENRSRVVTSSIKTLKHQKSFKNTHRKNKNQKKVGGEGGKQRQQNERRDVKATYMSKVLHKMNGGAVMGQEFLEGCTSFVFSCPIPRRRPVHFSPSQ